jgi:cell division protein FtsQ
MFARLKQLNWQKLISLLFFISVILFFAEITLVMVNKFTDENEMPLTSLLLTGQHPHVFAEDVKNILVNQPTNLNFFTLEIEEIQKELERLPWIYSVSIRKRWPDTIKIHIVEQAAVAKWNGRALLNRFSDILAVEPSSVEEDLVDLYGDDKNPQETLDIYNKIYQLIKVSKFNIVILKNDNRNSTTLQLKNGIVLRLGREQKLDRIQRYLAIIPLLERKYNINEIDYIDMRYDTGFSVGWKKSSVTKKQKKE